MRGKRALVTGAGSGIGLNVTEVLARSGAQVMMIDLDQARLSSAAQRLSNEGCNVAFHQASVADPVSVTAAFNAVDRHFDGLDILINNAGITGNCPVADLSLEMWNQLLAVNQTGTFLCAQAAGARMQDRGGAIVNLSSIYGLVAAPNRFAYSATKAAVVMMTKCLAVEWAAHNIRVNCVAPGYVETPGTQELADAGKLNLAALENRTPQKRLAKPEDISSAIIMLCEDRMAHVTGQVLAVDGGWSAYGYI